MNLTDASIQELEDLLQALEEQMKISPSLTLKLEMWYERVKEALGVLYNDAYENSTDDYNADELFI